MTKLLEQALRQVERLSENEQDAAGAALIDYLAHRDAVQLSDAQLALARSYGASSWTRIVQSCQLIDAIWDNDPDTVRNLVSANRNLLTENAGIGNRNWGPPMSYAANLGRAFAYLFMAGGLVLIVRGDIFSGVDSRTYDVPSLPAGTYKFECSIHPTQMFGTLTVQ